MGFNSGFKGLKTFAFLRILRFSQRCCWRYMSFGKWRYHTCNSSLLDCADLVDGSRVLFRSVVSYLPSDTSSYSGGFRSTNVRIFIAVIIFICSAMLYRSLHGNISWSFNIGPIGVSETWVRNYHYTLRSITEESISQLTTWRRKVEIPFSNLLGILMLKMEASSTFERFVTISMATELNAPEELIIATSISVWIIHKIYLWVRRSNIPPRLKKYMLTFDYVMFQLRTAAFKAYCAILVRRSNFRHQASPHVSPREST